MLFAAFVALVAVGLGLGLGLAPVGRARLAGPLRTFALSAALTVVVLHLLPEAFGELGVTALVLFAGTSVFAAWQGLVRVLRGKSHDGDGHVHGGLVAGYVGLLVHHVGDGLGLGAYAALPGGAKQHADVMLALGAHTVPLVAVVAFAFRRTGGTRGAVRAAAGLAGASVLGVVLSALAPGDAVEHYSAWIAALVAGLLVHVVTHDLGRDLPTSVGGRALDALAALAGVVACVAGGAEAMGGHAEPIVTAFLDISVVLSLPLLVGAVLVTLATTAKPGRLRRLLETAFGPSLGIDGLVVAVWLDGLLQGVLLAAGGVALVRVLAVFLKGHEAPEAVSAEAEPFLVRLDDFLGDSIGWIATAFGLAALIIIGLPGLALARLSVPVAVVLAAAVALPARLPAGPALVIVFALQKAGLCHPAALVFALLAPAPGARELAAFARRIGTRAALRLTWALCGVAVALAVVAFAGQNFIRPLLHGPFPGFKLRAAALLLAALALRAVFLSGLRGLLLRVFPSHDTASTEEPEAEPHAHHADEPPHAHEPSDSPSGAG